jgi:CheY-like chemotaxis protein
MSIQNNSEIFLFNNIFKNIERLFTPLFGVNKSELILNIADNIPDVYINSGGYICQALVRLLLELNKQTFNNIVQLTAIYHNQQVIVSISDAGKNSCLNSNFRPFVTIRKILKSLQIPTFYQLNSDSGILVKIEIDYSNLKHNLQHNSLFGPFFEKGDQQNEEEIELAQLLHNYLGALSKDIVDLENYIFNGDFDSVERLSHKMQGFPGGFQMYEIYHKIRHIHEIVVEEPIDNNSLIAEYISLKALSDELLNNKKIKSSPTDTYQNDPKNSECFESSDVKILVADDNPMNCELVCFFLDKLNLSYHVVSNGKEALERLEKHDYHVLLLDFQMPVLNGPDTIKIIRSQKKYDALIIVGLTTFEPSFDEDFYSKLGCNDFLFKPFTENQLNRLMQYCQLIL